MRLVFLHGPPAAGKLTTARALSTLTGYHVFHNHLVVDALISVFPFGSIEFVRLRELFWMETFRAAAASGRSLVFTFTPDATVPAGFPERVRQLLASLGGSTLFVRLDVTDPEQERRVENPDRRQFNKVSSLDTLRRLKSRGGAEAGLPELPPFDLSIDTDTSTAEQSARTIVEHFDLRAVEQPRGYPS